MEECDYCGKETELAFKCKYCGNVFCAKHRLPENHECPGLEEENEKLRDNGKIMAPTPSEKKKNTRNKSNNLLGKVGSIPNNLTNKIFKHGIAYTIIGITIISYIMQGLIPGFGNFMVIHPGSSEFLAPLSGLQSTQPLSLFEVLSNVLINRPWSIITSIFVHGSLGHLFINMLILFFFGPELEKRVGKSNFLKIFFLAGIAGSLGHVIFTYVMSIINYPIYIPALGASGAIFGVFTALAFIAPDIRVLVFFLIPAKIKHVLIFYIIYNIYQMIAVPYGGVGNAAHLAGILIGIYYGKKLEKHSYNRFNNILRR